MASRDYIKHLVTPLQSPNSGNSTIGDEWYDPTTNRLSKLIASNGTTPTWLGLFHGATTNLPLVDNTYDLGSAAYRFATFYGVASSARYADLAEKYLADEAYKPGTVVVFGGNYEVTISTVDHDAKVAGVVSTDPAYLMNADLEGLSVPVALTGRVPCLVQGPVKKGDIVVTSNQPGVAQKLNVDKFQPGCIIGKSLNDLDVAEVQIIEVVVGRF